MLTTAKLQELEALARRSRKRKKGKSNRSKFYSKLMGGLAGPKGEEISKAFVDGNSAKFAQEWWKLAGELIMQTATEENRERVEEVVQRIAGNIGEIQ